MERCQKSRGRFSQVYIRLESDWDERDGVPLSVLSPTCLMQSLLPLHHEFNLGPAFGLLKVLHNWTRGRG